MLSYHFFCWICSAVLQYDIITLQLYISYHAGTPSSIFAPLCLQRRSWTAIAVICTRLLLHRHLLHCCSTSWPSPSCRTTAETDKNKPNFIMLPHLWYIIDLLWINLHNWKRTWILFWLSRFCEALFLIGRLERVISFEITYLFCSLIFSVQTNLSINKCRTKMHDFWIRSMEIQEGKCKVVWLPFQTTYSSHVKM